MVTSRCDHSPAAAYLAHRCEFVPISRLVECNGSQLWFRNPLIEVLDSTDSILASIAAVAEAPLRWCSATGSCGNSTTPTPHRLLASALKRHRSEYRQKR